jgi:hypothetical protein
MNETKPKKVSVKVKIFCYVAVNVGIILTEGISALENRVSPERGLILFVASVAWVNFLFWFLFRMRDKNSV